MTWRLGPPLRFPLWGHCSVIVGGKIVVIGGWDKRRTNDGDKLSRDTWDENKSMKSVHALHGETTWEKLPHLKHGRSTHGCTVTNYKVD